MSRATMWIKTQSPVRGPGLVYLVDAPYGVGNIFAYIIPYHLKKENACSIVRQMQSVF